MCTDRYDKFLKLHDVHTRKELSQYKLEYTNLIDIKKNNFVCRLNDLFMKLKKYDNLIILFDNEFIMECMECICDNYKKKYHELLCYMELLRVTGNHKSKLTDNMIVDSYQNGTNIKVYYFDYKVSSYTAYKIITINLNSDFKEELFYYCLDNVNNKMDLFKFVIYEVLKYHGVGCDWFLCLINMYGDSIFAEEHYMYVGYGFKKSEENKVTDIIFEVVTNLAHDDLNYLHKLICMYEGIDIPYKYYPDICQVLGAIDYINVRHVELYNDITNMVVTYSNDDIQSLKSVIKSGYYYDKNTLRIAMKYNQKECVEYLKRKLNLHIYS
jgi:hypothetical protein